MSWRRPVVRTCAARRADDDRWIRVMYPDGTSGMVGFRVAPNGDNVIDFSYWSTGDGRRTVVLAADAQVVIVGARS